MHRRAFIGSCASGLVTVGTVVEGQPASRIYRVGILLGGTAEDAAPLLRALMEALRVLGLVDGRNLTFESRYAGVRLERLPELAAELVRLRVDVIVTGSNPFVAAAHSATLTIPIVFMAAADPVGAGFVASLAKPGGNITGLTTDASPELFAKNLGLLTEIVPNLTRVGVLRQADRAAGGLAELQAAARKLNVVVEVVDVRDLEELARAFSTMTGKRVGAVIVFGSVFYLRRQELADLALKHRLPAIHVLKGYAEAGLLMSYGPNLLDLYRRAASYVAKILGGTKPADLPVEQPAKLELVINLRTAKALGLTIRQSVLLRAHEVIQRSILFICERLLSAGRIGQSGFRGECRLQIGSGLSHSTSELALPMADSTGRRNTLITA